MEIGKLIRFHDEQFFEGAVQLRWVQTHEDKARQAAQSFVFHGPRYHAADPTENDGIESGYRLKDSASFVHDLLRSIQGGEEENPYWMVVAGYGSGKSHLALTCATLLGKQAGVTESVLTHIDQADETLGAKVRKQVAQLTKPVLVLPLDGMAGFHLGNALSQAVFAQLYRYGVDASAIRDLSPRFQTAEQFVERNFNFRADSFARHLPGLDAAAICTRLRDNDETCYAAVDAIYADANGLPIPVTGQESAQELINSLCDVYCGPNGAFSSVIILFDEFGRYLEYAADKPRLAGDAALQQIFQGVQDNSGKVRFIGFIQYELKAYLKRFSGADLRQLQRYITRFDAAQKWYLSTNLETIFAHMIGKNETELSAIWRQAQAEQYWRTSWQRLSQSLPGFGRFPVWSEFERFSRVIAQGCWPLHPLATWFLTRQRDVVQSRSALTFIKDMIERIATEDMLVDGRLRQVSAAELVLQSMLPELISAERETGATVAETLQLLLEKFQAHLSVERQKVLAGVAILAKMRIGKHSQEAMDGLIGEATALDSMVVTNALRALGQELGALEWNRELGQYELIADAASRGQFQQWLRKKQLGLTADAVRDLFIRRVAKDSELGDIDTDFGHNRNISTTEWRFDARFAHIHTLLNTLQSAFQEWGNAIFPNDAKGKVIYLYLHSDDNLEATQTKLQANLQSGLERTGQAKAPIWVISIVDTGIIAEHIGRLHLFDEIAPDDIERFRRFIPEEKERSRLALKEAVQDAIRARIFWIAGFTTVPAGRLKVVAEAIFAAVYPQALPFPFDGFATANGGGAADSALLMRSLSTQQVDGHWLQSQQKRLQNRTQSLLVNSWQVLRPDGKLVTPIEPKVKAILLWLQQCHQDQSIQTLWSSYQALIAPPYGMNASSAGLLLGLLIGGISPPRRIEQRGEMVASSDWVNAAFQKQKHYLTREILESSTLRFLPEDTESRWRNLLNDWENEKNYEKKVEIYRQAERMHRADPLPESLEGNYKYLCDKSNEALIKLTKANTQRKEWEAGIEKAERSNNFGEFLKFSSLLLRQREEMADSPLWPQTYVTECDNLLQCLRGLISAQIADWIPRQGCHTAAQISDFRHRMEKAIASLKDLNFKREVQILEQQVQRAISLVDERQRFKITLDESEDYPRQPNPSESTLVRDLRDSIALGDRLIEGVQGAKSALNGEEIAVRINAIKQRQDRLKAMLERHRQALGSLYSAALESDTDLQETLIKAKRLREIFIDTPDQGELHDLLIQLECIQEDINAWETNNVSPERLDELLQKDIIPHQLHALGNFLEEQDIEPAWNLDGIYQAIAKERIEVIRQKSLAWVRTRLDRTKKIPKMDLPHCNAYEQELLNAPSYLAAEDRQQIEQLLDLVKQRRMELEEQQRRDAVAKWQQGFPAIGEIEKFGKRDTERFLKSLRTPPHELLPAEQAAIAPILAGLTAHLDQISMDDILERIVRLSTERQRQLLLQLSERLKGL
ncbi:conserved hypothetical protein [Gammaproteobacteria bacterium]